MDYTEANIQCLLMKKFCFKKRHEMAVPNITTVHGFWESDLLSMTKSYFLHEFEIKTTRSDWLKEKKHIEAELNHTICKSRRSHALSEQLSEDRDLGIAPNYFWLCTPPDVILEGELPPYAGHIEVYYFRGDKLKVVNKAPRLHTGKCSDNIIASMYRSMNFKYWKMKGCKV